MQNIVKTLSQHLKLMPDVVFGYLFGSYANGDYQERSDVDVALFLQKSDLDTQLQINYELSKFLGKDVDLVVLNNVKNLYLLDAIFNEGKVIKDDRKRLEFEVKKQHEILDFKVLKKMIDAA